LLEFRLRYVNLWDDLSLLVSGAGSGGSTRHYTPPSSDRSIRAGVDSGSFGRKIEFSSSFDKYRSSSPTNRTTSGDSPGTSSMMMRRWSRQSGDHNSSSIMNQDDDDLEDFVRFVGSNQELRLFQQRGSQMLLSSNSSGDDGSLSHFQNLRDTHNSLSESLSSSMMIQQQQPNSPVSSSTTSSTGGRSYQPVIPSPLHHTAEQQISSPVHIPRSLPQIRSLASNQQTNALRITRLSQRGGGGEDAGDEDNDADVEGYNDMSAFATYPQDHHHDIHSMLRNTAATTGNSNRTLGRAITPLQQHQRPKSPPIHYGGSRGGIEESGGSSIYRSRDGGESSLMMQDNSTTTSGGQGGGGRSHSMVDDDDSLVFKMSELEFEAPSSSSTSQQKQQQMLFSNNRYNTQQQQADNTNNVPTTPTNNNNRPTSEHFLELTPTPLSPPLLHRLQAITMSTVAEEEEKSSSTTSGASGTSSNNESPTRVTPAATSNPTSSNTTTTSHHQLPPFDAW
jgi:hypothetical protein